MITIFFTGNKLIVFDILLKGNNSTSYIVDCIFPGDGPHDKLATGKSNRIGEAEIENDPPGRPTGRLNALRVVLGVAPPDEERRHLHAELRDVIGGRIGDRRQRHQIVVTARVGILLSLKLRND
jgi:hypothetical protein